MKLTGKATLVTGAGRGIGAAIARKLAQEGAHVLAADLDAAPLDQVVSSIVAAGGVARPLVGDVAEPGFGERAVESMLDQFGGIDIVVNNAGYIWNTTIQKTSDEQWQAMLDVHMTAPFRILRAAAPYLRESAKREAAEGTGYNRKVVNISSISGVYGAATQIAYASAKAGVIGMTRTLAREWGRYRVNVNAVAFGFIETRLTQEIPQGGAEIEIGERSHRVGLAREVRDHLTRTIPLGRHGTPEEAAGAVYLLCLPESDYVSGQILVCDGGGP
jgi:3-oxoacyl-[acyl-carrier protein] reductase